MKYTPEQFFRLAELVQDQGGVQVDELCSMRSYDLTGPKGKEPGKKLHLPGCGNYSIFSIPYEGSSVTEEDGTVKSLPGGDIRLCAVCDDLGITPRFASAMAA